MKVYKAISGVSNELLSGIAKGSKNQQQGFMFRGIDAVYNALAPALVKHELLILPRMISRESTERTTKNGGVLFYVTVEAEFDFISTEDGSKHTVKTYGEAMDSGDKATNKAMSIAYKYAAFQAFCIPTEETSIDADATTHSVAPMPQWGKNQPPQQQQPAKQQWGKNQPPQQQQPAKQHQQTQKVAVDALEGQTLNAVTHWLSEGMMAQHVIERLQTKYTLHPSVVQAITKLSEGK